MVKILGRLLILSFPWLSASGADNVWDPGEIARLSEEAAQIALQYSALIDVQQSMDGLAAGLGAAGARGSGAISGMEILASLQSLAPAAAVPDQASLLTRLPSFNQSASQRTDNRLYWSRAVESAAVDGVAVSAVLRQSLTVAIAQVQSLQSQAGSASDLRGDWVANSMICLTVFADLASLEAALALSLQQQSTAILWQMSQ